MKLKKKANANPVFDFKGFYSSIKETLLTKAINFVETRVNKTNHSKTK